MSLIYGLVARGATILAEHTNSSGNFASVTQAILEKIPPNNSKLTYVYDRYLFHYICEDGITYMCMADDSFGRRIPFIFLQDLKEKFLTTYGKNRALEAPPYGLNEFSRVIEKQMEYFSTNPNADRLKQVHGEIEQVKDVMVHNIERVLERGERIELLVDKTDNLNQQAFAFKKEKYSVETCNVVEEYQDYGYDLLGLLFDCILYRCLRLWFSNFWSMQSLSKHHNPSDQ